MQRGVPTIDFMTASSLLRLLANPKSLSLQVPFLSSILAGFKSRWMMPFLCRYLAPFMMSLRNPLASPSGIFFLLCNSLKRSPSWQNSVTMYMLLVVWQISWRRTMLSWLTFFMMSIQDWMFLTLQALEKIFLSITFTATGSEVYMDRPRQTIAQEPCPSSFLRLNWYFSIFFQPYIKRQYYIFNELLAQISGGYINSTKREKRKIGGIWNKGKVVYLMEAFTPQEYVCIISRTKYILFPFCLFVFPLLGVAIHIGNLFTCIINLHMSFREAFTRNSNSSEQLRYDDAAAYHFCITLLIIVFLPLTYSILKTILAPFSHIPTLNQLEKKRQFRDKIQRFKKENKYNYITFKFVLKILLLAAITYGIVQCATIILSSKEDMKGFDPYEILEVENNAPIEKIKKAYRKLALLYHPDRNQNNPEASAKFIMISKAYECLTDEQAKEKCLKYGNPDGSSSFNVGIALPSFLVKKQNHVFIMGVVFLFVVIVLPIYLIHYHSQMNKYDDFGMLTENQQLINFSINQQFGMKDAIKMVACCAEFANLATTRQQVAKLEIMLKQLDEDEKKALTKKNYKGFVKKALLLVDARVNEKEVPVQLQDDYKLIMKKTPIIIKSSINSAYERSLEFAKAQTFFIGKNCLKSLILFQQYFIQGKQYELSDSFRQLDLSDEESDKIMKKRKQKKITDLYTLLTKEEERDYMLSLLDSNRAAYIKECLEYYPRFEVEHEFKVDDQNNIGAGDFFQLIITVKASRTANFCSAPSYPFLKMEGWHIIVSDSTSPVVLLYEFFTFDETTKTFKVTYRQERQGKYSITINVMSDSYFGLDVEKDLKYEVGVARKVVEDKAVDNEVEDESYIRKLFKSLTPEEEEEVSDKQDEGEQKEKGESKGQLKEK